MIEYMSVNISSIKIYDEKCFIIKLVKNFMLLENI